ncbi:hypothetical protein FOZ62_026102, partial [Perkinsus olseni]
MVENPSPDSLMSSIGLQIAHAFGVENIYLLRYVTDEEFADKCEEVLTDKKMTVADILAWCDYMESIEDNRPQLYRSSHVSIKDVRDKMGSQEGPAGDATTNTTIVAAASTILGSTPLTATNNGKIDSKQVTSTAKYCSADVPEDSTLRVPRLSDSFVEVCTVCSSSIMISDVETALIAADISLKLYQWMDELSFAFVSRIYCLRFDSTAKLEYGPGGECGDLVSCCDRCYAHVHRGCWAEWRQNQRMTALRSRLTGLRPSGTDPFLCSICKTGQACVDGESHDVAWLAAVTGTRSSRGRQSPWEVLGSFGARSDNSSDSDEDDDLFADSEGVEDSPVCSPWLAAINFAALMVFAVLTPLGINLGWGSTGDVILVGFVGLYQ